jgi:TM2 domain-containing membrane protein YozV
VNVTQVTNIGMQHKRWSRLVAAILSFVIPGLGQLYKGQVFNGLLWFVVVIAGYVAFVVPGAVLHVLCILGAMMGDPYRGR